QLVQQFDREAGKIVDEVKRVLDLVRDAGGQLPERRHLLRMDQARLSYLQLAQCRLGSVSRGADRLFRAFAVADITVNKHKGAPRRRIAEHLDDAAIRSRALVAHLKPSVFHGASQLSFEIGRNVLAAVSKIAEIPGKAVPLREKGVRQFEHLL